MKGQGGKIWHGGRKSVRIWAVLVWLLVWQFAGMAIHNRILLVTPAQVMRTLAMLAGTSSFWGAAGHSYLQMTGSFLLSVVLGSCAAVLAAKFRWFEELLAPLLMAVRSVPVASFVILALVWLSSARLAGFIVCLMVFPILYTNVLQGIRNCDRKLEEMAWIFRISWEKRFRYVILPQILPFFRAGVQVALGLAWKAGIAAEVIGMCRGSIGERLQQAKVYLDTAELFAWTVVIVLLSFISQKLLFFLMEMAENWLCRLEPDKTGTAASGRLWMNRREKEGQEIFQVDEAGDGMKVLHEDGVKKDREVSSEDRVKKDREVSSEDGEKKDREVSSEDGVKEDRAVSPEAGADGDREGSLEDGEMNGIISVRNVSREYDGHVVFENLSMSFPCGQLSVLMAPSGQGKTTLLRMIAGLEEPDAGEICLPQKGCRPALVFQEDRLCEALTGEANIVLGAPSVPAGVVKEAMEATGLSYGTGQPVRTYSGGMKRRVSFLRCVLSDAKLLILDEPFQGLDEDTRRKEIAFLQRHMQGRTVLLVTHNREDLEMLGNPPVQQLNP